MSTIVYVWKNSPQDVGHVSIQVDEHYMSFWPKNSAKAKNDIKIGSTHEAVFPSGYKIDCRLESQQANHKIYLNKLDEKLMIEFWETFKSDSKKYNMLKSNCSTVVASLLQLGSGIIPNHTPGILIKDYVNSPYLRWFLKLRFLGNYIHMWTPNDVNLYALQIKSHKGG